MFNSIDLWIIPQNAAGFGDIACSLKITNYLVENCGFNQKNISIVTTKPEIVSIFNKHALNVISPEVAKKINAPSIKIVVPIRSYDNICQPLLEGKIPFIILWEYGIKNTPVPNYLSQTPHLVKSLGLEDDEEGILIEKEMQECSDLSKEERLQKLEMINPILKNALIGDLYFGYVYECKILTKFLKAIVKYNKGNNLTFIFPGNDRKITIPEKLEGVGSIEIFHFESTLELKEKIEFSKEGKQVRIITGTINHNDIKWIQVAAKKETIVTGDQSLGQAISTIRSRFIYECLPHKVNLGGSLKKLYPINPNLESPKAKSILQYFISCKAQKKQFAEVSQEICLKRNAFLKIPFLIQELV